MNIIVPIQAMIEIDRRLALMTENRNNFSFNEDFTTIILGLLSSLGCVGLYNDVSKVGNLILFGQQIDGHDEISG